MSVEEYRKERVAELGEFTGTVISEIYQGIREGEANNPGQIREASGREHESWQTNFANIKSKKL